MVGAVARFGGESYGCKRPTVRAAPVAGGIQFEAILALHILPYLLHAGDLPYTYLSYISYPYTPRAPSASQLEW